ncbi:hypothetical protein JTB14_019393 [Gonioctena quinquepunctata]|nr:hypothetical protein JTB14_019393 [Gonioctena quinquepunctata]
MSLGEEEVMYVQKSAKMNFRSRKSWQVLSCAAVFAYSTLLVYQTLSGGAGAQEVLDSVKLSDKSYHRERNLAEDMSSIENENHELTSEIVPVTATIKPPSTTLNDVFISVKTTKNYHSKRLPIILKTWFQLARKQTWFFTDTDDREFQTKTNGHMINTNCSSSHSRKALCCKMSVEFDTFLLTDKK